jgi:tetratricopeptide (TPR) repeat protein
MASQLDGTASPHRLRIGGRFQVDAVLGRGGMATVYRVTEAASQRPLALKQLAVPRDAERREALVALFEREFLTLAQLSHPRVIEVYDYGVEDAAPYYTMELLDGGDLRERSPLPWREACGLLAGVCSSLALIHSRRLVHRDVSPMNIRCTRDGEAKLIDFGAMAPMGTATSVVGTPAFVAPEVVQRLALDGRTDLCSFGATLYFALSGQSPYPARTFSQLAELWKVAPPPPSSLANDVPEALDSLVMSLLCLEPAMRPRTAFEVMQRLTAIAGIQRVEPISVSQAYLSTPVMIGRDEPMHVLRRAMTDALAGEGRSVLVEGASGMGRSRVLDAAAVEAKLLGAAAVRADGSAARSEDFAVAQTLAQQLLEALPELALASARQSGAFACLFEDVAGSPPRLRTLTDSGASRSERQTALCDWILQVAESQLVAIAVDDAHTIDESSAALLAALVSQARRHRLFVVATVETGAPRAHSTALGVLASRSVRLDLEPLTLAQTEGLLGSLFGDAQNLGLVSDRIYGLSAGNPRECMDLARHLVDKGIVSYDSGGWNLPVRLDAGDLPSTAEEAIRDRIAGIAPLARWLAETQAIANDTFGRDDYRSLSQESDPNPIDRAISELLSSQVLIGNGKLYAIAHRTWGSALTAALSAKDRQERHQALAALYERRLPIVSIRHLLEGGLLERGLDRLVELGKTVPDASRLGGDARIPSSEVATTISLALSAARELGRPMREVNELRRWMMQLSVAADDAFYWQVAPDWLEQLKRDSGLLLWHELVGLSDEDRVRRALATAAERYTATPEAERVYAPDEALRCLVYFVTASIAVGSRTMDVELLESLPPLLAPFVPISPLVAVVRLNAVGLCEAMCRARTEHARSNWIEVYESLGKMSASELPYRDRIRNAVAFAIGTLDVRVGRATSVAWAELLDEDPRQRVNALYLRKVIALQMGDAEEAERYRRKAEVLALQTLDPQMFNSTLPLELAAHALAGDLTGVQQVIARIQPLARTSLGWQAYAELAQAQFQQLRGDLESACAAFERCIAMASPDSGGKPRPLIVWLSAIAGHLETLIGLGRSAEARVSGKEALLACQKLGIGLMSHEISRALALAEAKLGDYAEAVARLEAVIDEQRKLGVTGVSLGASYEARARVAIWSGDDGALKEYARLTAGEYRHGRGSALGARWERLMAEARRASKRSLPRLADFESTKLHAERPQSSAERVDEALATASTATERAQRALALLCGDRAARRGYLYLVGRPGLALVASHGAAGPPEGLVEYLGQYLDQAITETGDRTAVLTESQMESALTATAPFRDATNVDHHPLLLTSLAGGMARHAGIAALVTDAGSERLQGGAGLVAALSAYLIQSGDTRGIP